MRTALQSAGKPFEFSVKSQKEVAKIIEKYPPKRQASAVIPLLDLAQRENNNWVSKEVVEKIASLLNMPVLRVFEVASFYTMFNLQPVGRHLIQVCRTTPCWLRGSDNILETCCQKAKAKVGETSQDGLFTIVEVECLGACANAPMVQINDDYYEDLTPETMRAVMDQLAKGMPVTPGSQIGRQASAPLQKGGTKAPAKTVMKLAAKTTVVAPKKAVTKAPAKPKKTKGK